MSTRPTEHAASESLKRVQLILKAQKTVAKAQVRRTLRALALAILSLTFLISAAAALHLAGYIALQASYGSVRAALIVGAVDFFLATALLLGALSSPPESDVEQLAREVTQASLESLGDDVEDLRDEFRGLIGDVRHLRDAVSLVRSVFGAPLQMLFRYVFDGSGRTPTDKS